MTENPSNENFTIRISDPEAIQMLRFLAQADLRSMGMELAFLIRQEYAKRFSQPSPFTLAEAESALTAK
jgi:hypothetical protein